MNEEEKKILNEVENGDVIAPDQPVTEPNEVVDQIDKFAQDEQNEQNIPGYENPALDQEPEAEQEVQPQEKMLTQSQVNDLVGRARQEGRESALKEMLGRYGVNDEAEMNDVFGRGQAYDSLNDDFNMAQASMKEVMAENALLKSQIDEARWDDVRLILGGKGMDVTAENIAAELETHPEWKSSAGVGSTAVGSTAIDAQVGPVGVGSDPYAPIEAPQPKYSTIRKLGEDISPEPEESEEALVNRLFGFNK